MSLIMMVLHQKNLLEATPVVMSIFMTPHDSTSLES
jgi:hypothetical protein